MAAALRNVEVAAAAVRGVALRNAGKRA